MGACAGGLTGRTVAACRPGHGLHLAARPLQTKTAPALPSARRALRLSPRPAAADVFFSLSNPGGLIDVDQ